MQLIRSIYFILFLWLGIHINGFAQDTIRRHPVRYVTEQDILRGKPYRYLDTSLNETEIFHPLYQRNILFQDLGNIGTASRAAVWQWNRPVGFVGAFNPYEAFFIQPETGKYYNTTKPFTELFYAQGAEELLLLKIKHAQNILPRWNVAVDFSRTSSQGFMLRQSTSHYNMLFNTRYVSKNKRYELLAGYALNRGVLEENGGIESDSAFEALSGTNKTVSVVLDNSANKYRHNSFYLKQIYRFGEAKRDIVEEDTFYTFLTKRQLIYGLKTQQYRYVFVNNGDSINSLLPNEFFTDKVAFTYDSLYNGSIRQDAEMQWITNDPASSHQRFISIGIAHEGAVAAQAAYINNIQNLMAQSYGSFIFNQTKWSLHYAIEAVMAGDYAGDHKAELRVQLHRNHFKYSIQAIKQLFHVDYNLNRFTSNQFIWRNQFSTINYNNIKLGIATTRFRNNFLFEIQWHQWNNWVFVNQNQLPEQASGTANIIQAQLNKTFQVGKFYFKHVVILQQSTADYMPVPEFGGMIRYYFQAPVFTSTIQIGVDGFYNSSWYGMAWNPASRLFFVQRETKIGNYPLLDPFIAMQLKRACIFFKYEHINQNLINSGFYNTPHHPISLQSFRLGIRWSMYD